MIVDAFAVTNNAGDPDTSTSAKLHRLFASDEQARRFFRSRGFEPVYSNAGVVDTPISGLDQVFHDDRGKTFTLRRIL